MNWGSFLIGSAVGTILTVTTIYISTKWINRQMSEGGR